MMPQAVADAVLARAGRARATSLSSPRLRARLHVEPAAHPSEPQHGQPAEGAAADGERVLLRRRVHARAGSGNRRRRRAEGGHAPSSPARARTGSSSRPVPVPVDDAVVRARAPALRHLLPAVPRRARRRQGHPVPARQRPDRLLPPGEDPEVHRTGRSSTSSPTAKG